MREAIDEYLEFKRPSVQGKTLFDYERNLRDVFLPWCGREGIEQAAELTDRALRRFSTHLPEHGGKKGPLSPYSVITYTRTAKWFVGWLEGTSRHRGLTPTPKQRILDVLTRKEIDDLEDAARDERDKLIIRTLANAGLRLGELLALRGRDVYSRHGRGYVRVPVTGKSGEREVPISAMLVRRLGKLQKDADQPIFMTKIKAKGGGYEPLRAGGVEQMIHHLGLQVLERRVYPHLFRHSFATHTWKESKDPGKTAKWLGHTSLTMLYRTYGHLVPDDSHADLLKIMED